jgi:hypothetical protein
MVEADMKEIAQALNILATKREAGIEEARAMANGLTARYPIYEQISF